MRARFESFWAKATPLQKGLVAGIPAVIVAIAAVGIGVAAMAGGGDEKEVIAPTATAVPPTKTPTSTSTNTPLPTPTMTPEPVASGGGSGYTGGSSSGGGGGGGGAPLAPGAAQTGPGPITGTDMILVIPKIGVNLAVSARTVGTNGQMGDPSGPFQVIWYDFISHIGLGGRPGQPGSNTVMAAHVDYVGVGPAAFYSIGNLVPGDIITVNSSTGTYNYAVQWSQWADPSADFSSYVYNQPVESITLVTCVGAFSGGSYSNRLIVRGTRV